MDWRFGWGIGASGGCSFTNVRVQLHDDVIGSICIAIPGRQYHDAAKEALAGKFGAPQVETIVRWQDGNGRSHVTPFLSWHKNGVIVTLDYRVSSGSSYYATEPGEINVTDEGWLKEIEQKKRSTKPL